MDCGLSAPVRLAGQSRYRELWQCYFPDAAGIIFVVDSTDGVRMVSCLREKSTR